jgi:hypothetical protein
MVLADWRAGDGCKYSSSSPFGDLKDADIHSFILEGIATVLIAFCAYFILHDFPDTASFLTIEERAWVVHRLKYQGSEGSGQMVAESEHFAWKHVRAAFSDWQIYVGLFVSP